MKKSENSIISYCPICKVERTMSPMFKKWTWDIYPCPSCSVFYVSPQPTDIEIKKIYTGEYFERGGKYEGDFPGGKGARRNHLNKLKYIQKYRPSKSGNILDVGCAKGGFLSIAKEEGYNVVGIDISEEASDFARNELNLDVRTSFLHEAKFPDEHFDVITIWDVLEHLPDPNNILQEVCRILRPDGIIAFSTGDIASFWAKITGSHWQLLTPPQHLFFFSIPSIRKILGRNYFQLLAFKKIGKWVSCDFIGFKANEAFGVLGKLISFFFRIPIFKRKLLYLNLFDTMTCIAVKANIHKNKNSNKR